MSSIPSEKSGDETRVRTRVGHRYIDTLTGQTLDTYFPAGDEPAKRGCRAQALGLIHSEIIDFNMPDLQQPPFSTEDAYLRLHLLSECQVKPNTINLDGLFDQLPNIAWTSAGPVLPSRVGHLRTALADENVHLTVFAIDKFPRMVDYVTPPEVRIGDPDRVRLGAHLSPGTTVMHEGFVNFNAGSIGPAMIEGRVTPGVVVDEGSDIGAGSSIMGTLSGGGKSINRVGKGSLLGANAGIGISLGNRCVVEAGLYVTAGTKVTTADGDTVAAHELSGQPGLLFRRNSITGAVEAVSSAGVNWGGLNKDLHKKN